MTPKLVSLKYSKGLDLLVVLRKGYRYRGMWAAPGKHQMERAHLEVLNSHTYVKSRKNNSFIHLDCTSTKFENHRKHQTLKNEVHR